MQQVPDQSHVVMQRQPPHAHNGLRLTKRRGDQTLVLQQVPVRHHDAFGCADRSGGILQECKGIFLSSRSLPGIGPGIVELFGGLPLRTCQQRFILDRLRHLFEQFAGGECERDVGVGHHAADTASATIAAWRIGGDRDGAGIQAAKEGGHEIQTLRVHQQDRSAGRPVRLQPTADAARTLIQVGVRIGNCRGFPVGQKRAGCSRSMLLRTRLQ